MKNSCAHESCALASLRGFRNGVEYAIRIRAAHCIVMILLYRRNKSLKDNFAFLFNASREHSINLGVFVFLYRLLRCQIINRLGLTKGTASFIAGGVGGAIVWGRSRTPINYQIVLYLLSRITVGLVHHEVNEGRLPDRAAFRPMASIVWAIVMWLFTVDPKSLQGSLRSSMEFLYDDDVIRTSGLGGSPGNWLHALLPFVPFSGV